MSASLRETGSREPSPSVSTKGFDPARWRAGSFRIAGPNYPPRMVAGWIYWPLALDRRNNGWAITHVPTGWGAGGVKAHLDDAQRLVEEMVAGVDWNFTDPEDARSRGNDVKRAETRCGVKRADLGEIGNAQGIAARQRRDGNRLDPKGKSPVGAADAPTLSQSRGASEMTVWQPIETAPKDDTVFIAACADGRMLIWTARIFALQNDRTPAHLSFPATHWMPLPEPPEAGE